MKAGDTFAGRYRIDGEVGAGGMGAVYAVTHLVTKRRGALKVILGSQHDAVAIQRFGREAELAGQLDTKHVVSVFDAGATPEGTPFLVMELLRGEDLSKLVARCGRVTEDLALRIASQCAAGLSRAHARGIVHRDIKTANVFLADGEGDEITVKVLDFGIAKLRSDGSGGAEAHSLTRTGSLLGSPLYMSPEQALGERSLDHRADLWSLGVTLYEMLCGRTPFHDEESFGRLLMAICHTDAPPIDRFASDLRPEVRALVGRLLQRDRDARVQSADELRATLLALTGGTDAISSGELGRTSALVGGSASATDGSLDETLPAEPFLVAEGRSGASLGSHDASRDQTTGRSRLPLLMLGLFTVVAGGAGGYAVLRGGLSRGQVDARPPSPATPSDRPPGAGPVVGVAQSTGADSARVDAVAAPSTTNSARPPAKLAASASHTPPAPAPRASTRPSPATPVAAPAQPPPPQPGLTATPKFE